MRTLSAVSSLTLALSILPTSHARPAAVSVSRGETAVLHARIEAPLAGAKRVLSVEEIVTGSPRTLVVEWVDTACGFDATPDLYLNETRFPLPLAPGVESAGCSPRTRTSRIDDAGAIAAVWREAGPNVVRLASEAPLAAVAWARVRVGDGLASPVVCVFDAGGGACDAEPRDASDVARGPFDVGATLPRSGGTARKLEIPFSGSEAPQQLDVSGLDDGRHALCVSENGTATCTEFEHNGEIELRVEENGNGGDAPRPVAVIAPGGPASECSSPAGGVVSLNGSLSTGEITTYEWFVNFGSGTQRLLGTGAQLSVPLPVGVHAVTLRVTDVRGRSTTAQASRTVVDTVPPVLSITMTPIRLWPAKHQMVTISTDPVGSDACGTPSLELTAVWSNEADDVAGDVDGNTTQDIQNVTLGTPDRTFSLRAETGSVFGGRRYQVVYTAIDAGGNRTPWQGVVWVRDPLLDGTDSPPEIPKDPEVDPVSP